MNPTTSVTIGDTRTLGTVSPANRPPVRTELAIIQPTPFCNINCRYCYLPERTSTKRISPRTLERISQRLFESPFVRDELTIVWHAGEPLVLPVDFYHEAHEILQRWNTSDVRVIFHFQTNATLINAEWCRFFQQPNVQVGVSLDGPRELHDLHRVDRRGQGTFDRAFRGLRMLHEVGLHPPVIMVVTRQALPYAKEIWRFFAANQVGMVGFNPEEVEAFHDCTTLDTDRDVADYKVFFATILRCMQQTPNSPKQREYEQIMRFLRQEGQRVASQNNVPFAILNFDTSGNISTFSPELLTAEHEPYGDFIFGNVYTDPLESILRNEKFRVVNEAISQGVSACKATCAYFEFCGGGSPSNKIGETGSFAVTETQSCRLQVKAAVGAVLDHFESVGAR